MEKWTLIAALLELKERVRRRREFTSFDTSLRSEYIKSRLSGLDSADEQLEEIVGNFSDYYATCGIGLAGLLEKCFSNEDLLRHRLYVNPTDERLRLLDGGVVILDRGGSEIALVSDSEKGCEVYSNGKTKVHLSGNTWWRLRGATVAEILHTNVHAGDYCRVTGRSDMMTSFVEYASAELEGDGSVLSYSWAWMSGAHLKGAYGLLGASDCMEAMDKYGIAIRKDSSLGDQYTLFDGGDGLVSRRPWTISLGNRYEKELFRKLTEQPTEGVFLSTHYEPARETLAVIDKIQEFLRENGLTNLEAICPQSALCAADLYELLSYLMHIEDLFVKFLSVGGCEVLRQCFTDGLLSSKHIYLFDWGGPVSASNGSIFVGGHNVATVRPGQRAYFFESARGFVESTYAVFYGDSVGVTRDAHVLSFDRASLFSLNGTNVVKGNSLVSAHGYNATCCYDQGTVIDDGGSVEVTLNSSTARRLSPILDDTDTVD